MRLNENLTFKCFLTTIFLQEVNVMQKRKHNEGSTFSPRIIAVNYINQRLKYVNHSSRATNIYKQDLIFTVTRLEIKVLVKEPLTR